MKQTVSVNYRRSAVVVVMICAGLTVSSAIAQIGPTPCGPSDAPTTTCQIVVNKELMIRELCVVEDPIRTRWTANGDRRVGVWTFGKLIASIGGFSSVDADPIGLSEFVRHWLGHWLVDQNTINPQCNAAQRAAGMNAIISLWEQVSQVPPGGVLNMRLAPFRLLAIVDRLDLRKNPAYGNGNAGEGRFVFGVLNIDPANPNPDAWTPMPRFTTILEYKLPASTCDDVIRWARNWHALGSLPFGETYNAALPRLTDAFRGFNAAPGRPNGSSIGQVRTDEFNLGVFPWELREFHLSEISDQPHAPLNETTVALTADSGLNNSGTLDDFIRLNEDAILNDTITEFPLQFEGSCFRGVSSLNFPFVWNAPSFHCTKTRFKFMLLNCNGCHSDETHEPNNPTGTFLMIAPRAFHSQALLSQFLTGAVVPDPGGCAPPPPTHSFNDLKRRADDLCDVLNSSCVTDGTNDPLFNSANSAHNRVH